MKAVLDSRFKNKVKGMFGKYHFEVGILEDASYRKPQIGKRGFKGKDVVTAYAGGPVRKKSRQDSGMTIAEIAKENRERLGVNFWTDPFQQSSSDIIKFSREFFKVVFGYGTKKRAENLLQAIVRNPILRGEYGDNSEITQKIKGFNRPLIDTAQMFKAIKAKCVVK